MEDDRADPQDADPIAADDKDWTWVLDTACPECGFDASALPTSELDTLAMGELLRSNAAARSDVLATGGRELSEAGEQLAEMFDGVRGDQWQRTGYRSDGASFTVDSFGRYLMHDVGHHLWDVGVGR